LIFEITGVRFNHNGTHLMLRVIRHKQRARRPNATVLLTPDRNSRKADHADRNTFQLQKFPRSGPRAASAINALPHPPAAPVRRLNRVGANHALISQATSAPDGARPATADFDVLAAETTKDPVALFAPLRDSRPSDPRIGRRAGRWPPSRTYVHSECAVADWLLGKADVDSVTALKTCSRLATPDARVQSVHATLASRGSTIWCPVSPALDATYL